MSSVVLEGAFISLRKFVKSQLLGHFKRQVWDLWFLRLDPCSQLKVSLWCTNCTHSFSDQLISWGVSTPTSHNKRKGVWRCESKQGYAIKELVCPTTLEGKSLYSCSGWPHLKVRGKACRHREMRYCLNMGIRARSLSWMVFIETHSFVHTKSDRNCWVKWSERCVVEVGGFVKQLDHLILSCSRHLLHSSHSYFSQF